MSDRPNQNYQDHWVAFTPSPPPSFMMPEANEIYEQRTFGGSRYGFNDPHSRERFTRYPTPSFLTNNDAYSTMKLPPMQPTASSTQRMAPHPQFPDNTDQGTENVGQRMSIDVPYSSRKTSNMTGIQQTSVYGESSTNQEYVPICQCPVITNPMLSSPSMQILAEAAFNKAQQYTRVPVDGLLNNVYTQPVFNSASVSNQNIMPSRAQGGGSGRTIPDMREDINIPMHGTKSTRSQSLFTGSTTSSSTLRPRSFTPSQSPSQASITAQRCFLLNTLYNICLEATALYIRTLVPHHRHHRHRCEPYPSRSSYSYGSRHGGRSGGVNEGRAKTLMGNISSICTHLWRKARHSTMASHAAEASAVRTMRDLYAWSELVVRGRESDGLLSPLHSPSHIHSQSGLGSKDEDELEDGEIDGDGDGDGESVSTVYVGGEGAHEMSLLVGRGAKRICEWAGNGEAWESCESVVEELRGLRRMEREGNGKQGWRVVEVGSEGGSIT